MKRLITLLTATTLALSTASFAKSDEVLQTIPQNTNSAAPVVADASASSTATPSQEATTQDTAKKTTTKKTHHKNCKKSSS